jgi:hypothetical protein
LGSAAAGGTNNCARRKEIPMQAHFFSGRMLSADAMQTEQSYSIKQRGLAAAPAAAEPPPNSLGEAVLASLPQGLLDEVALNPQPLPPRDAPDTTVTPQHEFGGDPLEATAIQDLMSAMQRASSLASTVTTTYDQTTNSIVKNIG